MIDLFNGDCLEKMKLMEKNSVDCVVTSPPYNKKGLLGKFKKGNQIWSKFEINYSSYNDNLPEDEYQLWMIAVINEMHRVIKDTGSIFFNHKPRRHKNRCYLPTDFISKSNAKLYQLIIWDRKNSPNIRSDILVPCTEHIYWLCKIKPVVYRNEIDKECKGEIWSINHKRQKDHPAPFPYDLAKNCILLTTKKNDIVLDPFMGSGTAALVCKNLSRDFIGIEIDENYCDVAKKRISC